MLIGPLGWWQIGEWSRSKDRGGEREREREVLPSRQRDHLCLVKGQHHQLSLLLQHCKINGEYEFTISRNTQLRPNTTPHTHTHMEPSSQSLPHNRQYYDLSVYGWTLNFWEIQFYIQLVLISHILQKYPQPAVPTLQSMSSTLDLLHIKASPSTSSINQGFPSRHLHCNTCFLPVWLNKWTSVTNYPPAQVRAMAQRLKERGRHMHTHTNTHNRVLNAQEVKLRLRSS